MTLYLVVAAGAVVAGFVQGLSGFAFGLVAMSFWVWAVDPKVAATLTVFGGLLGQLIAAFSVRRGFKWNQLLPFVLGGIAGIPVGVWLLPLVDANTFKIGLGVILLICQGPALTSSVYGCAQPLTGHWWCHDVSCMPV